MVRRAAGEGRGQLLSCGTMKSKSLPPAVPAPLLYAVGDVHGCYVLLEALWRKIEFDAGKRLTAGAKATVVFLGDLIDRGPDSDRVLRWCAALAKDPPAWCVPVFLVGNHELFLLQFLMTEDREILATWRRNGGKATLRSLGVGSGKPESVAERLRSALKPDLLPFFSKLKYFHAEPGYLFVHAGLRPGVALEEQKPEDLCWIREEFLLSTVDHGARIIHGHTPAGSVEILKNRINVDTCAYGFGVLSAVRLQGDKVGVLQAKAAD